jgi:hypothetical protein
MLGTDDVHDRGLDKLPPAVQQGATRLERGRNAYRAAEALAQRNGWTFNWRLVEVPGVGHDAPAMYGSREASAALFGEPPAPTPDTNQGGAIP